MFKGGPPYIPIPACNDPPAFNGFFQLFSAAGRRSIDLQGSMLVLELGLEVVLEIGGYCGAIFRTLFAFCGMQYLKMEIWAVTVCCLGMFRTQRTANLG